MADENRYRTLLRRTVISQIVIVLILAASGLGFWVLSAQKLGVKSKQIVISPLNIDSFSVAPVSFREIITAYGTALPDREVVVAAQVNGQIVEVHPRLEVGQSVTAPHTVISTNEPTRYAEGDLLVRIDERDYANRVQQSKNRINEATRDIEQLRQQEINSGRLLAKAKSDVVTFQQEYDRYRRAVDLNAGAESELNRALVDLNRQKDSIVQVENQLSLYPLQIAAAQERLSTSRSEHQQAENDLERTAVLPPFDGILSEVLAEFGQFVRAGEPLVRIIDIKRIEIPVAIGLEDWRQIAASLAEGRHPTVRLATGESGPVEWTGVISSVAPEVDPGSRTIQVFVKVLNEHQKHSLLPGTFVHARISGDEILNKVIIPRNAVLNDHVFVIDVGRIVRRQRITQGRRLKSLVVINSGLDGAQQIATTNLTLLQDGKQVAVQETTDLVAELHSLENSVIELIGEGSEWLSLDSAHSEKASDAVRE